MRVSVAFSSLNGRTITLSSDELAIKKSLDIEGPGASLLAVSGNDTFRVFDVVSEGLTVRIAGLTITHGRTVGNNGGFNAGPGWDPCTGLGRPDGSKLASAIASRPMATSAG